MPFRRRTTSRLTVAIGVVLGALIIAAPAAATSLGTVVVDYSQYPTWAITPSSLTGVAGDTFGLQNNRNNDNGLSYVSLVNGTGSVTKGGTSCATTSSCTVLDSTGAPNTGTFTVVTPGTLNVNRYLNGSGSSTIGTLTIIDSNPTPAPVAPVAVTGVTPASGLTTGGERVTITGTGFADGASVTIGGQVATDVTVASGSSLSAMTPAHSAGAAAVTVTVGSDSGTKTDGYVYNQGYWLTVSTRRPADIGRLTSPGAIRTSSAGTWASNVTTTARNATTATHAGYSGGINCGQRGIILIDTGLFASGTRTNETWDAGACRYAFAAGSNLDLSALTSSYQSNWFFSLPWITQYGFLGGWGGDCPASTAGSSCSVSMTADRTVTASWGFANFGFLKIFSDVTLPVFAADGSVQYFKVSGVASSPPTVVGGTPTYFVYAFMPAATAQSREDATAAPNGPVACRATARLIGRRVTATCKVTPILARALAAGTVRLRTRWYMRPPHQSTPVLIHGGRVTLRNRRASQITG